MTAPVLRVTGSTVDDLLGDTNPGTGWEEG